MSSGKSSAVGFVEEIDHTELKYGEVSDVYLKIIHWWESPAVSFTCELILLCTTMLQLSAVKFPTSLRLSSHCVLAGIRKRGFWHRV